MNSDSTWLPSQNDVSKLRDEAPLVDLKIKIHRTGHGPRFEVGVSYLIRCQCSSPGSHAG